MLSVERTVTTTAWTQNTKLLCWSTSDKEVTARLHQPREIGETSALRSASSSLLHWAKYILLIHCQKLAVLVKSDKEAAQPGCAKIKYKEKGH